MRFAPALLFAPCLYADSTGALYVGGVRRGPAVPLSMCRTAAARLPRRRTSDVRGAVHLRETMILRTAHAARRRADPIGGPVSPREGPFGPLREPPRPSEPSPKPSWTCRLLPIVTLAVLLVVLLRVPSSPQGAALSYSDFLGRVGAGQVKTVDINDTGAISGTLKDGGKFTTRIPTALDNSCLEQQLQSGKVEITASRTGGSPWGTLLVLFLPVPAIVGLFLWAGSRVAGAVTGGLGAIGRARAKIIETERPTTRFEDVAGYEGVKQEIGEIVDFLRNPERYAAAGAEGPRGVIMVDPPGTGKTRIARAVAGEAEVPFLSVTGSALRAAHLPGGGRPVLLIVDRPRSPHHGRPLRVCGCRRTGARGTVSPRCTQAPVPPCGAAAADPFRPP
ncbi:ATP-dependent metallopeptidase FtsH/Yme1/Tma family protein [Streptomyces sp. NPDC055103]